MNVAKLTSAGIDYASGVARFLGDTALYELVLTTFLADPMLEQARAAYARKDRTALLNCVHDIKGSSGNADMTRLYLASSALVALLRSESYTDAALDKGFQAFEQAYLLAKEGIRDASEA